MQAQRYGRIVMTTSSSGLYGNFGQSNYGAAKMALVGLMQTLALEGAKHNIRVNCLAPTAATRMLEGLLPSKALARLSPTAVSPGMAALVGEEAPNRLILCAGAGAFEAAHITLTQGVFLGVGDQVAGEVVERLPEIIARDGDLIPADGFTQSQIELRKAQEATASPGGA
jgi:NAD(P)-dependent dehydrogenase (short-subunit alcohol dehydrogenase family)